MYVVPSMMATFNLQIRVPPQLAEVLKNFTKEVIRRQPEDLVEFSAFYFSNLANLIPDDHAFEPPTVSQVREIYKAVAQAGSLRTCDVRPPLNKYPHAAYADSLAHTPAQSVFPPQSTG